jgi:hypothetical protein
VYREIAERPLFIKSRRPPEIFSSGSDAVSATETAAFPERLQARAVVITPEARRVLLYDRNDRATFYLDTGAVIEGWRVMRIERQGATLTRGHRKVFLEVAGGAPPP